MSLAYVARVCDGANPSLKEGWREGTSLRVMSCAYMCFSDTINDIRETADISAYSTFISDLRKSKKKKNK